MIATAAGLALLGIVTLSGAGAVVLGGDQTGSIIGAAAAGTAALGGGGYWFVTELLARLDRFGARLDSLERSVSDTRENVATILGRLGVERRGK